MRAGGTLTPPRCPVAEATFCTVHKVGSVIGEAPAVSLTFSDVAGEGHPEEEGGYDIGRHSRGNGSGRPSANLTNLLAPLLRTLIVQAIIYLAKELWPHM